MIHSTAEVQTEDIGKDTFVWQHTVILAGARIGQDCNVNAHCFIENDVVVGDEVTVKSGVYLWDGVELEDRVFVGPNVTFTNDVRPRSKQYPEEFLRTKVCEGASIGAAAVILPGLTIGRYAMVAAGSVVTRDVPPHRLVMGSPARVYAKVCICGRTISENTETCSCGEVLPS